MNKISKRIEATIKAEIKKKQQLVTILLHDQEDYKCDNKKKIAELEEIINYYERIIDNSKEA